MYIYIYIYMIGLRLRLLGGRAAARRRPEAADRGPAGEEIERKIYSLKKQ